MTSPLVMTPAARRGGGAQRRRPSALCGAGARTTTRGDRTDSCAAGAAAQQARQAQQAQQARLHGRRPTREPLLLEAHPGQLGQGAPGAARAVAQDQHAQARLVQQLHRLLRPRVRLLPVVQHAELVQQDALQPPGGDGVGAVEGVAATVDAAVQGPRGERALYFASCSSPKPRMLAVQGCGEEGCGEGAAWAARGDIILGLGTDAGGSVAKRRIAAGVPSGSAAAGQRSADDE